MSHIPILTAAFMLALTAAANTQQPCRPLAQTPELSAAFHDSTLVSQRRDTHPYITFVASITEAVALRTPQGCLTAFAYSEGWPRPFMGALFILDAGGTFVASFYEYASPTQLVPAGPNRLAFRSVDGEGTGVLEAHVRVLCSFGTAQWAECLELPLIDHLWRMDGLSVERDGTFVVRGDHLRIVRTGAWHLQRHGEELRGGRFRAETLSLRLP
jgi:hypothetical protein